MDRLGSGNVTYEREKTKSSRKSGTFYILRPDSPYQPRTDILPKQIDGSFPHHSHVDHAMLLTHIRYANHRKEINKSPKPTPSISNPHISSPPLRLFPPSTPRAISIFHPQHMKPIQARLVAQTNIQHTQSICSLPDLSPPLV